ncbi:MAG: hypothetical protein HYW37_02075 [Candidatus Colwellbacteria bacterium]|nr:hypothetical protein [Candidatus Colwellbacteria bacterium]
MPIISPKDVKRDKNTKRLNFGIFWREEKPQPMRLFGPRSERFLIISPI